MKIGIFTLPLHTNYGGILQAYALQTVLERMGHDVKVLTTEWDNRLSFKDKLFKYPPRLIKKFVFNLDGNYIVQREEQSWENYMHRAQHTEPFVNNHIKTYRYKNISDIKEDAFDAIVVGSDQIWRAPYITNTFCGSPTNAFLDFAKGWEIKRVAYAASLGVDVWEYSEPDTLIIRELVKKFDGISVREESGVGLCNNYLNITAYHVLDPTMLLTSDDYINSCNILSAPKSSGSLLNYVLDSNNEKISFIEKLAKSLGKTPFSVSAKLKDGEIFEKAVQPPVEEWLRGFYDAEYVVTDSFHACVFSIIYGKPFLAIANKERGAARFESLLSMFGLEDRLVYDTQTFDSANVKSSIKDAQLRLDGYRKESMEFLKKYL